MPFNISLGSVLKDFGTHVLLESTEAAIAHARIIHDMAETDNLPYWVEAARSWLAHNDPGFQKWLSEREAERMKWQRKRQKNY